MILLAYFLMNDNHASDSYAWAGLMLRQAYAMRLHRDPESVCPEASEVEKQVRRKLWQAISFQDTFLTVLLKLPPTATHSDVHPDSLVDESILLSKGVDIYVGVSTRVLNLMSIDVIAPPADNQHESPLLPQHATVAPSTDKTDCEYIRSMWKLSNLVQENICSPSSLSIPLFGSPRLKASLISSFRALYRSFPTNLTTTDFGLLQRIAATDLRTVRQNLWMNSNYYHCMMVMQASENEAVGVHCNIHGTLEAAHEAIWAFFKLYSLFEVEAGVWWVFQHRAFEEAVRVSYHTFCFYVIVWADQDLA